MTNNSETQVEVQVNTIPYSAEAVGNLANIERAHRGISLETYRDRRAFKYVMHEVEEYIYLIKNNICQLCSDSISDTSKIFAYPCPTLTEVRTSASKETRIAAALILSGDIL